MAIQPGQIHHERYKFEKTIGQGAFGVTWQAKHILTYRSLAIKVIDATRLDKNSTERVMRECRIGGQLDHPHIVSVFDAYKEGSDLCIVMELLVRGSLEGYLAQYQPSLGQGLQWGLDLADALAVVHDQGIIHRDIKPANILLTPDYRVKIADFGIAHSPGSNLTGVIQPGTPAYHSPEQDRNLPVDSATDVYALCGVLFETFTGTRFFQIKQLQTLPPDEWREEILYHLESTYPDALEMTLNALVDALTAGLMVDKSARSTLSDLQKALKNILDTLPKTDPENHPLVDRPKRAASPGRPRPERVRGKPSQNQARAGVRLRRAALPHVEITSSKITLSPTQRELLRLAFPGHHQIVIENELRRSESGVQWLVVLPVRSQHLVTRRVIVKLASAVLIQQEWQAYREYVAGILPQETAQIQSEPLTALDGRTALLRYPFLGDVGNSHVQNLINFYQTHSDSEITRLLTKNFFDVMVYHWWSVRSAVALSLRREYDHLLPVHFVVERVEETQVSPIILKAGTVTIQDLIQITIGQSVQIQGFEVEKTQPEQNAVSVWASPADSDEAEKIRIQLTGLLPGDFNYHLGEVIVNFGGTITATRQQLLSNAAQIALPDIDLAQQKIKFGTLELPNPLQSYREILERPLAGMVSSIHGNLLLENILVEPRWQWVGLLNFADTREGHNIYDLILLEAQVVSRLLPGSIAGVEETLETAILIVARMLHATDPPDVSPVPALQKPYTLLRTIRYHARQCLRNQTNWDEYYPGLVIALLGASSEIKNTKAARISFIWAATIQDLIERPLETLPPPKPPNRVSRLIVQHRLAIAIGVVGLALVILTFWGAPYFDIFGSGFTSTILALETSRSPSSTVISTQILTPIPTSTPEPTFTFTPIATSGPVTSTLNKGSVIRSGPAKIYPTLDAIDNNIQIKVTGRNAKGDWVQIPYPPAPGGFAWVEAKSIQGGNVEVTSVPTAAYPPPPTVTPIPSETATVSTTNTPIPTDTPLPTAIPTFTPSPSSTPVRIFIENVPIYQKFVKSLAGRPPTSASFAPDRSDIAATEGAKLYLFDDGGNLTILVEEDNIIRSVERVIWSPTGQYIAFVADYKQNCNPCRVIGIVNRVTGAVKYLEPPDGKAIDLPRWTQDERLLVTAHDGNPARGVVYVYDVFGTRQIASGKYELSGSLEGQRWFPWEPGKSWEVGQGPPSGYFDE